VSNLIPNQISHVTTAGKRDADNSTTANIAFGTPFEGTYSNVPVGSYLVLTAKSDAALTIEVIYSPDGTNADSTITRYYRTDQIEPPHIFVNARPYVKVRVTKTEAGTTTYCRVNVHVVDRAGILNIPIDATMSQDYDSISVRPSDYKYEVALGRRQGASTWNKFGYNTDVDSAAAEAVWSPGGAFVPLYTAEQLDIVSASAADDNGSTGANSIVVYGVDADWDVLTEVVTLDGTNTVQTVGSFFGVNRMSVYLAGSGRANAGAITATAPVAGTTQAQVPAGSGTTQQAIFCVPRCHQFLADWLRINVTKTTGGSSPRVTVRGWVYSAVSNCKYEVFRCDVDTSVENQVTIDPSQAFVVGEKSFLWFECTTNTNDTVCGVRFSGVLVRDVDA
jgi:hypothetical protein